MGTGRGGIYSEGFDALVLIGVSIRFGPRATRPTSAPSKYVANGSGLAVCRLVRWMMMMMMMMNTIIIIIIIM